MRLDRLDRDEQLLGDLLVLVAPGDEPHDLPLARREAVELLVDLGDLPGGGPETAVNQTRLLYAGANRMTATRLSVLDLPEGNAMRAPGEASA